jgi:hypothetical protein
MPRSSCWLRYAFASTLAFPVVAAAQGPPPLFSYATYFECDPAREARADALMRETFFPIFDRHVAAKRLTGYGWLAHNLGGHWRRSGFMVGSSRDAVLDAQSAILKEMQARSKEFAELTSICPRHEDYIWRRLASSQRTESTPRVRSPARVGVYYECNPARQSRVDTLVTQSFAPIWNRYIRPDGVSSWSWNGHVVGGNYRRLLLLNGASHKVILASIDSILADIGTQRAAEGTEFSEICHSHQDYLWDIQAPRP